MNTQLSEALNDDKWENHTLDTYYHMDGKGKWRMVYYPIFEDGKTGKPYGEPRALMEDLIQAKGRADLREVPLRYVTAIRGLT